jgi:hypothetical protein
MARGSAGGPRKTGKTLVMEEFQIDLSPEERQEFERDHVAFLRRYLPAKGLEVRSVSCTHRRGEAQARPGEAQAMATESPLASGYYHIAWPERSAWI